LVTGREQQAGGIVLPGLRLVALELFVHGAEQVAGSAALAHQQVHRQRAFAQRGEVVLGTIGRQCFQIAVQRLQHVVRHRLPAFARLQQIQRGITGGEGIGIRRRGP